MKRLCVIFHVQHHSDSGGHYKQQNMLGLGKKKNDSSILIDSHFYEPISIIKSQSMLFSVDEWTVQRVHLPSNKSRCYFWYETKFQISNSVNFIRKFKQ